ncbi:MAG: Translation initiation factor IF-2 protein, partial [Parcubacteria group bacterium Gr01-1014_91]
LRGAPGRRQEQGPVRQSGGSCNLDSIEDPSMKTIRKFVQRAGWSVSALLVLGLLIVSCSKKSGEGGGDVKELAIGLQCDRSGPTQSVGAYLCDGFQDYIKLLNKKQVLGARHVSGALSVGDRVKIMRKGEEIARGSIKNLQQARSDVKEIHTEGDFGTEIEARADAAYGDELVAFAVTES